MEDAGGERAGGAWTSLVLEISALTVTAEMMYSPVALTKL
jgi:hypothetical protein